MVLFYILLILFWLQFTISINHFYFLNNDYSPLWYPFNFSYTAIFNATAFPVTSVPLGLSKEGLPLGVQVVSAPEHDHFTIAIALELHKKFGGWQFPK